jgi:TadE-like protein
MSRSARRRGGGGQALTEFALVAPILFLLLFSVIQLGLLFAGQNGLVNGVRDAARRAVTWRVNDASVNDPSIYGVVCAAVHDELVSELAGGWLPGFDVARLHGVVVGGVEQPIVSYHWEANPGYTGADPTAEQWFLYVEIDAAYDHPLYLPLVGWFFDVLDGSGDGAFTLRASEQMRVENPSLPMGTPPATCT